MTIEEMKKRKRESGYTNEQVAKGSGVPLGTIQKIFSGRTEHPRYDTIEMLSRFFENHVRENERGCGMHSASEGQKGILREGTAEYSAGTNPVREKQQGEYTLEDYYALPEDRRVELIDGVFYDMTAPSFNHQDLIGEIFRQAANYIIENNGPGRAMVSPLDVQLDRDDRTMVEPDFLIICDESKIIDRCIYGAPDFVLEVISRSTKKKDYTIKLAKYQNAGVREYWIVDLDQRMVVIYYFEDPDFPKILPMKGKIPVNIYDGKFAVDFDFIVSRLLPVRKHPDDAENQ